MTANREPCPVSVATSQLDQQAHCYGGPHHHSHAVHDHGQRRACATIAFFIPRRLAICIA